MTKDVVLWTGAGQIGMAIARRIGFGKKLLNLAGVSSSQASIETFMVN